MRTMAPSTPSAAAVPSAAGRQPRKVATASTMVKASTTSTREARKVALMAGAAVDQVNIRYSFPFQVPLRSDNREAVRAKCSYLRPKTPGRSHQRSEEHTSELQSLMRISYAVFCLKKKNNNY